MSKASPKIQFELDITNRFEFVACHADEMTIYLKQGDGTSYIMIHATREQLEDIANTIQTHFKAEDICNTLKDIREMVEEDELV